MKSNAMKIMAATLVALGLHAGSASGKECAGVGFPDQVQVDGASLTLNGLGLRLATMLKVKVYVAGLYVGKTTNDAGAILGSNAPAELVLHFVRDVGGDDVRKGFEEGFEKNAKARLPALKERIAQLNGWIPDVKSGQKLTFIRKPGAGILVDVNGTEKGTVIGDDFATAFLSIWLGDPPNSEIKTGLLGGACGG